MASEKSKQIITLLKAALVCVLALALWLCVYRYDNKYTASNPQAFNGVLTLTEQDLADNDVIFLVDGWEYYGGVLLTPDDFAQNASTPDQYIFIGRYGGFEAGDKGASPHGSASYRLLIQIPEVVQTYMLELPEIYSAYRLYINGKLVMELGNPDPDEYIPETGNRTVSIEAGGSIEITFTVSDFSHLYSGMVYPPAFGEPQAVNKFLNARLFFRTALCATALTIGLLSILISLLSHKNRLALLYGLLCVLFVGYICYPITQTFFSGFQLKYAIENFCFCAMLVVVILLVRTVCRQKSRWSICFILFGCLMCLAAGLGPLLWRIGSLQIMLTYSTLVSAYQWITALFITLAVFHGVINDAIHTKPLLYGILVFDTALVMDRLLPVYEPIICGWFIELASFLLVMSVGIAVGQEVAMRYRDTAILTERAKSVERLYQSQQTYYEVLKREMAESKKIRHDMHHHFRMIDSFLHNRQYDKLSGYVSQYNIEILQSEAREYCPIDVINILAHHYAALAAKNGIHLDIRYDLQAAGGDAGSVKMSDSDLCCLFSNLMENAVEACMRIESGNPYIRIAIVRPSANILCIYVKNYTDDRIRTNGSIFMSSKDGNRQGYGLLSIQSIAVKYQGETSFSWDRENREFESKVTVMA